MLERSAKTNRKVRLVLVALSFLVATIVAIYPEEFVEPALAQARRTRAARRTRPAVAKKYSEFPHNVAAHKKECVSCHTFPSENWNKVRAEADAFPDVTEYPKHESCLNCHRQQFFRGRPAPVVCSICHTNPSPRDSRRHPFPNPRELFDVSTKGKKAPPSDFEIQFPHDKHIDIVTASRGTGGLFQPVSLRSGLAAEESCVVCHKTMNPEGTSGDEFVSKPPANIGEGFWLKKGTFKSVPIGHASCLMCHAQDSGMIPAPTDCATCHKLAQPKPPADFDARVATQMGVADRVTLDAWRRRDSSGKFRHEFASHSELSCDTCHTVATMNTTVPATKKVAISSCAMCHATATAADGGALNVEMEARKANAKFQCTKCHVTFGTKPVPESHRKAIVDAGGTP
ncbi:MAG TPA: cytochrome c3 family protein [Pyrinomonadaceae bacterium]|nr:cytochrome c3 family protein [Pyrinomonadaceae bacterium]